jgi:hypothetical protein
MNLRDDHCETVHITCGGVKPQGDIWVQHLVSEGTSVSESFAEDR